MKPDYCGRMGDALLYTIGECKVMLSGPAEHKIVGWHFSISHPTRNPTWEEQRDFRYAEIPDDVYMVSIMPPRKEYVNRHPFCFHWYEAGPKFFDLKTGRPTS
jgi:hypothetical protein